MRPGVVLAAVVAACAVWVAPSAGTPAACDPGQKVVKGTSLYVYCGPARATVKVGGKTYRIFGGKCKRMPLAKLYVVDVGIITIAGSKPTARYLGIRSKRLTPGTTRSAGIAVQVARRAYNVAPSVVKVAKGMRSGTFSGDALGPAGAVSGSWTC
jgi:hypothetical protein